MKKPLMVKAAVAVVAIMALFLGLLAASPSLRWETMLSVYGLYERATADNTSPTDRLKNAEERLRKNPDDAGAWYERGLALDNDENREDAIAAAQRAVTLDPGQKKYHWLVCYLAEHLYEPEQALAILDEQAFKYPKQGEPWFFMYLIYDKAGAYDKSVMCLRKVVELEPDKASNYGALASTMLYGGEVAASLPYFDKAISLMGDPGFFSLNDRASLAMVLSQKALALSLLGKNEEALRLTEKARGLNPNDTFCVAPMVYSNVALGHAGKAVDIAGRAKFHGPDEDRLQAYALLSRNAPGDQDAARALLHKALVNTSDKDAVLTYALLGERDKALDLMARVVGDNPHMKEYYRLAPELSKLRDDPRFASLTGS